MKISRPLKLAFALGLSSALVGCKSTSSMSPMNWFSGSSSAQSTAPEVQYNGMSDGYSTTVRPNANATVVSGAKPENPVTKAWKSTTSAVTASFGGSKKPQDNTSLSKSPGKLDADLYVRAARFAEDGGHFADAESKYKEALKVEPRSVAAIVGLARLYDKQENSQQAVSTYQQALRLHPNAAMVYNDFGLCYARRREFGPAHQMLQKAVEIEPGKANYRNNLATVLVDMGKTNEAYQQLLAVQAEPVAHYNLAYLLSARGQKGTAIAHLQQAVASDPTLTPAHELLAELQGGGPLPETISQPNGGQPRMQMASATVSGGSPAPIVSPPRQTQRLPEDSQAPEIDYGPAANESGAYQLQSYESSADAPRYPHTRMSHIEPVKIEEVPGDGPATVRITDDE